MKRNLITLEMVLNVHVQCTVQLLYDCTDNVFVSTFFFNWNLPAMRIASSCGFSFASAWAQGLIYVSVWYLGLTGKNLTDSDLYSYLQNYVFKFYFQETWELCCTLLN